MRALARLLALAAVLVLGLAHAADATTRPFPRFRLRTCSRADFTSAGVPVRAELCRAIVDAQAGRAVIVLHGCGGFSTFDHRLAGDLPQKGIATLYVDFFAPTPPPGRRGFCGGPGRTRTGFRVDVFASWEQVVLSARSALAHTPGIDPHRIGIVGWSLGGGLAVATAASAGLTPPFAAVVGFSTGGGRGEPITGRLPPMLLLSGGTTDAIPLSDTRALYDAARAAGDHVELFVYPHGRHDWAGAQGRAGMARTVRFLRTEMV